MRWTVLLTAASLAGCATNIGQPQTRDEFVSMYKTGGMLNKVERATVDRPIKAVTADVADYAKKCLAVQRTRPGSYQLREVGGTTTYNPKLEAARPGVMALSVQEYYGRPEKGMPPDGLYTFVAEFQPAGPKSTQLDIYYIATRGTISDALKQWAAGDKRACPNLKN
jgi:hypothetical protein